MSDGRRVEVDDLHEAEGDGSSSEDGIGDGDTDLEVDEDPDEFCGPFGAYSESLAIRRRRHPRL